MAEVYKEHFEDANIGVPNYRWIYPHCSLIFNPYLMKIGISLSAVNLFLNAFPLFHEQGLHLRKDGLVQGLRWVFS